MKSKKTVELYSFHFSKDGKRYMVESEFEGKYYIKFIHNQKSKLVPKTAIIRGTVTSSMRKNKETLDITSEKKNKNKYKIIGTHKLISMGIDGSTSRSGVSIFKGSNLVYIDAISPSGDVNIRIYKTIERLRELISEYGVEYITIEDIYLEKNKIDSFKKLAMLQGCMVYLFTEQGIKFRAESPSAWKAGMGTLAKREESKRLAIKKLQEETGKILGEDEAESFLIGVFALKNRIKWEV